MTAKNMVFQVVTLCSLVESLLSELHADITQKIKLFKSL
jgi:hypothetical protein